VKFREPLLMCDLDGLGYQEIAHHLSVPLGTIRSRISRARGRLRDELKDYARESGFPVDALPAA
jgi:RNA polymerase sigma-70 factor (ECF subfamily)